MNRVEVQRCSIIQEMFKLNLNFLLFHSKDNTTQTDRDICDNKDKMHSYENQKNWVHNLLVNISTTCKFLNCKIFH